VIGLFRRKFADYVPEPKPWIQNYSARAECMITSQLSLALIVLTQMGDRSRAYRPAIQINLATREGWPSWVYLDGLVANVAESDIRECISWSSSVDSATS